MKHPQAAELMAMAQDMDTPMQAVSIHGWVDCSEKQAIHFISAGVKVRVKPKTIMIGDMEVTEPMRVAPEVGAAVWLADTTSSNPRCTVWVDSALQNKCLNRRICQATEEGARDMLAALVKQLGGVL